MGIYAIAAARLRGRAAQLVFSFRDPSRAIILLFGLVLLVAGLVQFSLAQQGPMGSWSEAGFDDQLIRNSVGNLFKLIEGAFGALVMVIAGLFAIIAAAIGSYRAALGMLVVAVGAFILRALVSLFFGTDFTDYSM